MENERMAKVETRLDVHDEKFKSQDNRLDKLENNTTILSRMELILEQQVEMNRDQHVTLSSMNENLTNLNKTQEKMQHDISSISNRVEKVEKTQEVNKEKYKLDLSGLPKKAVLWGISLSLGLLSMYIYIKFGLK